MAQTNQKNQAGQVAAPQREQSLARRQRGLESVVDRIFRGWLGPFGEEMGSMRLWDVNMTENDQEVVIRADVPGFEENELDVQVSGDMLTIKAEKERRDDGQEEFRSYFRSITLPAGIDANKIEATCKNGVLEL